MYKLCAFLKLLSDKAENIDKIKGLCYHEYGGMNMTKTKKIITFSLIGVLVAAVLAVGIYCLCVVIAFGNSKAYCPDIVIEDPSGNGTLIIEEWEYSSVCGAEVYYKKDGLFAVKKQIGSTSSDGAVLPFKNENYTVTWADDSVSIEYHDGNKQVTQTFELP